MIGPWRQAIARRWRRWRWWGIGIGVFLLLAMLNPVLDLVGRLFDLFGRLLTPLLDTTLGRVLVLLLACAAVTALAWGALRSRLRHWRGEMVLGRHLRAVAALVGDDTRRARQRLRRVTRYRGPAPADHPAVVADAHLKLARLALHDEQPGLALRHLASVPLRDLPAELRRSFHQLRAEALRRQGSVPPAALAVDLEEALAGLPDDWVLLRELRLVRLQQGDAAAVVELQQRIARVAPPAHRLAATEQLLADLRRLGDEALARGDHATAERVVRGLRKADPEGIAAGLLQGRIRVAAGDPRGAIEAWGRTRSPEGLDLIAGLLREQPQAVEPRELLGLCPLQGTLLLVARELARRGEQERAARAARLATESLGPSPSVVAALTEVLELLGRQPEARNLRAQAVRRLVAGDGEDPVGD